MGREEIVASLSGAFFTGHKNIVLITGPPGIGKSEVAKAVCIQYLEKLETMGRKGKCYCLELLSSVESEWDLYARLCTQLGGSKIEESNEDQARSLLNKLPPSSLLFVDACEKADVTHISKLIATARRANGELRFILTSQVEIIRPQLKQPLRVETLGPLKDEHALKILQHEVPGEGLNADILKKIRDLLDGVPLFLSLAASLLAQEYTLHELLDGLKSGSREDVLSESATVGDCGPNKVLSEFFGGLRTREGTLEYQAAISASIFPGTISHQAFQAVCGSVQDCSSQAPSTRQRVNRELIGKLKRWHVVSSNGDHVNPRYQMHSYLKQHATDLFATDAALTQKVQRAFLSYFADVIQDIALEEEGEETKRTCPADIGLLTLDSEHENVDYFLTLLTDSDLMQQNTDLSSKLVKVMTNESVGQLLSFRFSHEKRIGTLQFFFQNVKKSTNEQNQAGLLLEMAKILLGQGQFDRALQKAQEALQLCRCVKEDEKRKAKASCLEVLGTIKFRQHFTGFHEAETHLKDAYELANGSLTVAEQRGQPDVRHYRRRVASVCKKLGELYSRQKKFEDSNRLLSEAESHFTKLSGKEGLSCVWLYHRKGGNFQSQHKFKDAEEAFLHGLELCDKYKAKRHPVWAKLHYSLGRLYNYHEMKNLTKSLTHYNSALSLQEDINPFHVDVAQTCIGIGRVNNEMVSSGSGTGDLQAAQGMFAKAKRILEDNPRSAVGPPDLIMAELYSSHAFTYRLSRNYREELRCLQQAWDVYEKQQAPDDDSLKKKMATCMTDLGHAYRRLGNKVESGRCFKKSRELGGKAKGRQK